MQFDHEQYFTVPVSARTFELQGAANEPKSSGRATEMAKFVRSSKARTIQYLEFINKKCLVIYCCKGHCEAKTLENWLKSAEPF